MWSGIVHHKSDRKSCVLPTADRNIVSNTNTREAQDVCTTVFCPLGKQKCHSYCNALILSVCIAIAIAIVIAIFAIAIAKTL